MLPKQRKNRIAFSDSQPLCLQTLCILFILTRFTFDTFRDCGDNRNRNTNIHKITVNSSWPLLSTRYCTIYWHHLIYSPQECYEINAIIIWSCDWITVHSFYFMLLWMTALYFSVETTVHWHLRTHTVLRTKDSLMASSVPPSSHCPTETLASLLISKWDRHSPVHLAFQPPGAMLPAWCVATSLNT